MNLAAKTPGQDLAGRKDQDFALNWRDDSRMVGVESAAADTPTLFFFGDS